MRAGVLGSLADVHSEVFQSIPTAACSGAVGERSSLGCVGSGNIADQT